MTTTSTLPAGAEKNGALSAIPRKINPGTPKLWIHFHSEVPEKTSVNIEISHTGCSLSSLTLFWSVLNLLKQARRLRSVTSVTVWRKITGFTAPNAYDGTTT